MVEQAEVRASREEVEGSVAKLKEVSRLLAGERAGDARDHPWLGAGGGVSKVHQEAPLRNVL